MTSPTIPAHDSSAPSQTNSTVATTCQAMWKTASSDVNHPAKKLSVRSCQRRVGR